MPVIHHLGFEIAPGEFRLIEMRFDGGVPAIVHADGFGTRHNYASPLLHDLPYDANLAEEFIRDVTLFLRRNRIFSSDVSVGLDPGVPLIAPLPIDRTLDAEHREEQVRWECAQMEERLQRTQFSLSTVELPSNGATDRILAIAIPLPTVEFLASVFSLLTLRMTVLDIGHFAVENIARLMFRHDSFGLLGIREKGFTVSLYENDTFLGYADGLTTGKEFQATPVVRAIHRIVQHAPHVVLHRLLVYGEGSDRTLPILRPLLEIEAECLEPLAQFPIPDTLVRERAFAFSPTTFCAAAGLALRTDP